jgi:hypothetical protein
MIIRALVIKLMISKPQHERVKNNYIRNVVLEANV